MSPERRPVYTSHQPLRPRGWAERISRDLLLLLLFRLVLGLALAAGGGFLGWITLRLFFPIADYNSAKFLSVASLLVGGIGGIGAGIAWWRADNPLAARVAYVLLVLAAGGIGGWIGLLIARQRIHYTWISGIGSVPTIYQQDAFNMTVSAAVLGVNLMAGAFYLVRSLFRQEL